MTHRASHIALHQNVMQGAVTGHIYADIPKRVFCFPTQAALKDAREAVKFTPGNVKVPTLFPCFCPLLGNGCLRSYGDNALALARWGAEEWR